MNEWTNEKPQNFLRVRWWWVKIEMIALEFLILCALCCCFCCCCYCDRRCRIYKKVVAGRWFPNNVLSPRTMRRRDLKGRGVRLWTKQRTRWKSPPESVESVCPKGRGDRAPNRTPWKIVDRSIARLIVVIHIFAYGEFGNLPKCRIAMINWRRNDTAIFQRCWSGAYRARWW